MSRFCGCLVRFMLFSGYLLRWRISSNMFSCLAVVVVVEHLSSMHFRSLGMSGNRFVTTDIANITVTDLTVNNLNAQEINLSFKGPKVQPLSLRKRTNEHNHQCAFYRLANQIQWKHPRESFNPQTSSPINSSDKSKHQKIHHKLCQKRLVKITI